MFYFKSNSRVQSLYGSTSWTNMGIKLKKWKRRLLSSTISWWMPRGHHCQRWNFLLFQAQAKVSLRFLSNQPVNPELQIFFNRDKQNPRKKIHWACFIPQVCSVLVCRFLPKVLRVQWASHSLVLLWWATVVCFEFTFLYLKWECAFQSSRNIFFFFQIKIIFWSWWASLSTQPIWWRQRQLWQLPRTRWLPG